MQTRHDHINTHKASVVLNLVYLGDAAEFARGINRICSQFGHPLISEAAVRRYCDGGKGYEKGPPAYFAAIVEMLYTARLARTLPKDWVDPGVRVA